MSVTTAANALVLAATIAASMGSISAISLKNNSGEFFRKIPTDIEEVSSQKMRFTFWLNENEGNDTIIGLSLYGNGATTALGTGTEIVTQTVTIQKDNTQSLLIYWEVEVVIT